MWRLTPSANIIYFLEAFSANVYLFDISEYFFFFLEKSEDKF